MKRVRLTEVTIPRAVVDGNKRMTLRVSQEAVIEAAEPVRLSARDHERVLDLLENPPKPNARLRAAIMALPGTL